MTNNITHILWLANGGCRIIAIDHNNSLYNIYEYIYFHNKLMIFQKKDILQNKDVQKIYQTHIEE